MSLKNLSLACLLSLVLVSCITVDTFEERPGVGGTVVVVSSGFKGNNSPEVMLKAEGLIRSNCGDSGFKIIRKGYVKVGVETVGKRSETNKPAKIERFGNHAFITPRGKEETSVATTKNQYQWRIKYKCNVRK